MSAYLYVGMGPPYVVRGVIQASADFNPVVVAATYTAVVLHVTKPNGQEVDWTATVVASSAASLTVEHLLNVNDLDQKGAWSVWASFTVPSGSLRTYVGKLPPVLVKNQLAP